MFDGTLGKVLDFITACKLYIRMKMRRVVVEEQIQQILSYVQGKLANVWKENFLEDLEGGLLEYKTARQFLADIKKKFEKEDEETVKVVKLKRLEQEGRIIKEFVQEFRRAARGSKYKGRPLVKEFK